MNNKRLLLLVVVVSFWTVFILLSACIFYVFDESRYTVESQFPFSQIILRHLLWWGIWIGLTFAVLAICQRFPITTVPFRNILIHILAFAVLTSCHIGFVEIVLQNTVPPEMMLIRQTRRGMLRRLLTDTLFSPQKYVEGDTQFHRQGDTIFVSKIPTENAAEVKKMNDAFHLTRILRGIVPMNFLLYCLIVGAWHAFNYYRLFRERELHAKELQVLSAQLQSELVQAQLHALRSQLQPHFLFNTLNSIVALVRSEQKQNAIQMLTQLGALLRYVLEEAKDDFVTLEQELHFIRGYISIEEIRFHNKLIHHVTVEPEVSKAQIPNLILQPLIENAVKHGLSNHLGTAHIIHISAFQRFYHDETAFLCIEIADNGVGLPPGWNMAQTTGIGLQNVQSRLQHIYGEKASLDLRNRPDGGVIARICLPMETPL
jgi:two-component sensor histidine kinase